MGCGLSVPAICPSSSTLTRFPLPSTGSARNTFAGFIGTMRNSDFSDPVRVLYRTRTVVLVLLRSVRHRTPCRQPGPLVERRPHRLLHNGQAETSQVPGEPTRLPCPALRPRGVARLRHYNANPAAFHFENSVGLRT